MNQSILLTGEAITVGYEMLGAGNCYLDSFTIFNSLNLFNVYHQVSDAITRERPLGGRHVFTRERSERNPAERSEKGLTVTTSSFVARALAALADICERVYNRRV